MGASPPSTRTLDTDRRTFHKVASIFLGSILGVVLSVPGVAFVLSPILKRSEGAEDDSGSDGFQPIAKISDLEEGIPRVFPILGKTTDAWVKYPEEPIGAVWVIRKGQEVKAFSADCPHLGCAVGLGPDGNSFYCPCHTSSFAFDGAAQNKIPPRGMDSLEVKTAPSPSGDDPEIRVKFQRFRTAIPEKTPLA